VPLVHKGDVCVGVYEDERDGDAVYRTFQFSCDLDRPSVFRYILVAENIDLHLLLVYSGFRKDRPFLKLRWSASRISRGFGNQCLEELFDEVFHAVPLRVHVVTGGVGVGVTLVAGDLLHQVSLYEAELSIEQGTAEERLPGKL